MRIINPLSLLILLFGCSAIVIGGVNISLIPQKQTAEEKKIKRGQIGKPQARKYLHDIDETQIVMPSSPTRTRSFQAVKSTHKTNAYVPVEGYRTRRDEKGNAVTEYVHGEVQKGKHNIYSGYLYDKNNKKTYIYGNPADGVMQVDETQDYEVKPAKSPYGFK